MKSKTYNILIFVSLFVNPILAMEELSLPLAANCDAKWLQESQGLSGSGQTIAVLEAINPFEPCNHHEALKKSFTGNGSCPEKISPHGTAMCGIIAAQKLDNCTNHGIAHGAKIKYVYTPLWRNSTYRYVVMKELFIGYDFENNKPIKFIAKDSIISRSDMKYFDSDGVKIVDGFIVDDSFYEIMKELTAKSREKGQTITDFMISHMKQDPNEWEVYSTMYEEEELREDFTTLFTEFYQLFTDIKLKKFSQELRTGDYVYLIDAVLDEAVDEEYARIFSELLDADIEIINVSDALPLGPKTARVLMGLKEKGRIIVIASGNAGFKYKRDGVCCSDVFRSNEPMDTRNSLVTMKNFALVKALNDNPELTGLFMFVGALKKNLTTVSNYSNMPGNFLCERFVVAWGNDVPAPTIDTNWGTTSGTSAAAAYVTSIVALLKEAFPKKTGQELGQALIDNANRSASFLYYPKNSCKEAIPIGEITSVIGQGRVDGIRTFNVLNAQL